MDLPSPETIVDDLSFFDDWEQRYQYIIDLGKALPNMPTELHTPERLVKGCQSNVWMDIDLSDGKMQFQVDSDALIVKGLLVLVLAAYNDKAPQEILDFNIDNYFQTLDLERHLSPTRGNGLKAMVGKIRSHAEAYSKLN